MNPFESVALPRRARSKFNLSFSKLTTLDMGQLIPVACEEMVPGDHWQISNEVVIRFMPMVAPVLHPIWATVHWFAVPFRLLFEDWEDFITGGKLGTDATSLPRWTPTGGNVTNDNGDVVADNGVGSLWDYLGFPVGVVPTGALPLDFPKRAYNLVWNEYYRDETLDTEVTVETSDIVLNRRWRKDYLTSALPWQQRGTAPSIPLTGTGAAEWAADVALQISPYNANSELLIAQNQTTSTVKRADGAQMPADAPVKVKHTELEANTIDMSGVGTFDLADLRDMIAVQRWMELNARGGIRYVEWLRAHFGVAPRDERLQRPEYIGGFKSAVITSEVLQTSKSEAGAPQGNLAGHGLCSDRQFCGSYRANEFGVLIGILSVMPEAMYDKGIDRQWLRASRYDYFDPLFANLSEQPIQLAELYATGVEADNEKVFGYQGRYDEMRVKRSLITGKMRTTFDYWHIGRQFGAEPALNSTFLKCVPRKDFLAAPTEVTMVAHVGNQLLATRMMPSSAEPGFIGE